MSSIRILSAAALLGGAVVGTLAEPAAAENTVTVTVLADGGAGSLRAAISTANTDADDTTIVLAAGVTYDLDTCPGTDEDSNVNGDLDHSGGSEALTIEGNGATVRQTCAGERVLHDFSNGDLTIVDLTVTGGDVATDGGGIGISGGGIVTIRGSVITGNEAGGDGGGVDASGGGAVTVIEDTVMSDNTAGGEGGGLNASGGGATTTISGSTFSDNVAGDGDGGGVISSGGSATTTVTGSTFTDNEANGEGGGLYSSGGSATTTISGSTFTGNEATDGDGGAVNATGGGAVFSLEDSTVAGNTAAGDGGGVLAAGGGGPAATTVTNSTITGNAAGGFGGGLASLFEAPITLTHVTLVDNRATFGANLANPTPDGGPGMGQLHAFGTVITNPSGGGESCDLPGPLTDSLGYNLNDDDSCGFDAPTDLAATSAPGLGALADNGGGTPTRLPSEDSVLVDAIATSACHATVGDDQRGIARPQFDGCDVGAVERSPADVDPAVEPPTPAIPVPGQPGFTG